MRHAHWLHILRSSLTHRRRRPFGVRVNQVRPIVEVLEDRTLFSADFGFALGVTATQNTHGQVIATDGGGNVYVAGVFQSDIAFGVPGQFTTHGGDDIFVAVYSSQGIFEGAFQIGSAANDQIGGIAVDATGNIYLAGTFQGTLDLSAYGGPAALTGAGSTDGFLLKINSSGTIGWAVTLGGTGADTANAMTVDAAGSVFVTGSFHDTATFGGGATAINRTSSWGAGAFVARFDTLGNAVWASEIGGLATVDTAGIVVDSAGNIVVGGTFDGTVDFDPGADLDILTTNGGKDVFIDRLTGAGSFVWADTFGGTYDESFGGLAADVSGNVYVTGSFYGSVDFDPATGPGHSVTLANPSTSYSDIFVVELGNDGVFGYASRFGGSNNDESHGVCVDGQGNVYVTGGFFGTADVDPSPLINTLTSVGDSDAFVVKLAGGLQEVWAARLGGTGADAAMAIALDSRGAIYTTGAFGASADFDPGSDIHEISGKAASNAFVSKLEQHAAGYAGTLDSTFGNKGLDITDYTLVIPREDDASGVVVQADGKIIEVGYTHNGHDYDFALVRFNTDGSFDSRFGNGGKTAFDFGHADDYAKGILLQSDGKILVYGTSWGYLGQPQGFAAVRFNTDGSVDTGYGSGGKSVITLDSTGDVATSAVLLSGNRLVIAGYTGGNPDASNSDFAAARLTANGILDGTFAQGGKLIFDVGSSDDRAYSILAQSGDRIILGGNSKDSYQSEGGNYNHHTALVRLDSLGHLDRGFGSNGTATILGGGPAGSGYFCGMGLQSSGLIAVLIGGDFVTLPELVWLNSNGGGTNYWKENQYYTYLAAVLPNDDLVFAGGHSVFRTDPGGNYDENTHNDSLAATQTVAAVAVQSDSKILVASSITDAPAIPHDFLLTRFTSTGQLDNSFNTIGSVRAAFGMPQSGQNFIFASALQADGKIVVVGEVGDGAQADMIVARYNTDGALDTNFGGQGYVHGIGHAISQGFTTIDLDGRGDTAYAVAIQADGKIVVGGTITETSGLQDFALVWLDASGHLDTTFRPTGISIPLGASNAAVGGLAIQPDGKILATGYIGDSHLDLLLARFRPDGTLDNTFGSEGLTFHNISNSGDEVGEGIVLQPDGKIVVGGYLDKGLTRKNDFIVLRYTTTGDPDSFGDNGAVITDFGGDDQAGNVALTGNGRIVVCGFTTAGSGGADFAVAYYDTDGSPSGGWNGPGKQIISFGSSPDFGGAVAWAADDKLIFAGAQLSGGFELARVFGDGGLSYSLGDTDLSFNGNGLATTSLPAANFGNVLVQPDGKVIAVGSVLFDKGGTDYNYDFALARFTGVSDPLNITLSNTTLYENSPAGTVVGAFGTTWSNDGFNYSYSLDNSGGGRFAIVGNELRVADGANLDFEHQASYVIWVHTVDAKGFGATSSFVIRLGDLDEPPGDFSLSASSVPEYEPVGTVIGTLSATDQDLGDSVAFSLAPDGNTGDNRYFAIDAAGHLRTAAVFDFEARDTYTILVRASDSQGLYVEQNFTIHVTYVPSPRVYTTPNAPVGATSMQVTFSEPVVGADQPGNYELRSLGLDGLLDTADDGIVPVSSVNYAGTTATLHFASLPQDVYRLTVKSTIADPAGLALDGDGDGQPGGAYSRDFVALPRPAVQFDATTSVSLPAGAVNGLVPGDFNKDGMLDLVGTDGNNKLTVLLGDGHGAFAGQTTALTGGAMVAADFNQDSNLDLAVATDQNNIVILLGNGRGGFSQTSSFSSGGIGLFCLAAADFNGDGKLDLAVSNFNSDNIVVFRGDGSGHFAQVADLSNGASEPAAITALDVNGDDKPDIVAAYFGSSQIGVFTNTGAGFSAQTPFSAGGSRPLAMAVADFNSDGRSDVAMANRDSNTVTVFTNTGAGLGLTGTYSSGGQSVYGVIATDFNSDGRADFVALNHSSANIAIYAGDGSGDFSAETTVGTGGSFPLSFVAGDFSGDTLPDLLTVNFSGMPLGLSRNSSAPPLVNLASHSGRTVEVQVSLFGAGQLVEGTNNPFDGLNRLQVGGGDYSPTAGAVNLINAGRTVVTPAQSLAGLTVHREITVPNAAGQSFARTVEVLQNSTESGITTTVRLVGNLGSDAATQVFATSTGGSVPTANDQWFGTDDADGSGTPAVIHYIRDSLGLTPDSVQLVGDNVEWTYTITVKPGETLRLAEFTIVGNTRAEAIAAAGALHSSSGFGEQAAAFLSMAELKSLANFRGRVTYSTAILADTPVGYWRLGEASGTAANDATGNNHTGTYASGTTLGSAGAIPADSDTAATFVDLGHVDVPNATSLDITGPFTLEAWINTSTPSVTQGILEKYDMPGFNGYVLRLQDGVMTAYTVGATNSTQVIGNTSIQANTWYHVAAVYDGASLNVYVNGVLDGTTATTMNPGFGTASLKIGAFGDIAINRFNGRIDEAAVYAKALSAAELQDHYKLGSNSPPMAHNNTYTINANEVAAGNVMRDDTGAGEDGDPDPGQALTVTAIDGQADRVGQPCSPGAGGASLTLNADGTFTFDPTGSSFYHRLPAGVQSGDVFSYSISDPFAATSTATVLVRVVGVNDAPVLIGDAVLPAIHEDAADPPGVSVTGLFNGKFSDADSNGSMSGVAVVGNWASAGEGVWQYSSDGGVWFAIGAVNDTGSTLALPASTLVRFLPTQEFSGSPGALIVRALDNSYGGDFTDGPNRTTVDTSVNGGVTPIAVGTAKITTSVISDTTAPTSSVAALPAAQDSANIALSWSGHDNTDGTGIFSYDLYVADNGSAFTRFLQGTQATSTVFAGKYGHGYAFYSVATDRAGNREAASGTAQASISIGNKQNRVTFAGGVVRVWGTDGGDAIDMARDASGVALQVSVNGAVLSNTIAFSTVTEIRIFPRAGDDTVTIKNLPRLMYIEGSGGTNRVVINGRAAASSFMIGSSEVTYNGKTITLNGIQSLTLNGQADKDTLTVSSSPGFAVKFNGNDGADSVQGANGVNGWALTGTGMGRLGSSITFAGTEKLLGGTDVDTLTGPAQAETWSITDNNSGTVAGIAFSGMENLQGGSQADTFVISNAKGVSGWIDGGAARNALNYSAYTTSVQVDLQAGTATQIGAGIRSIRDVFGGAAADILDGDVRNNLLVGNGGQDSIDGRGGSNILIGGSGADQLTGGDGRDLIFGGLGADTLSGGAGEDILFSGTTTFENNRAVLDSLFVYWNRQDLIYATRVSTLRAGNPGVPKLDSTSVIQDTSIDTLTGGDGLDWYFAKLTDPFKDMLTPPVAGEAKN